MKKTEEEINNDIERLRDYHIRKALEHLHKHEQAIVEYMADFVASLCDVRKEDIHSDSDVVYIAHARWLYWYACRYLMNESYSKMSEQSSRNGHTFSIRTIQNGTSKMATMVEDEPTWKRRWSIVRHIIKLYNDTTVHKQDNTIVIQVPKGMLNDKVQIKIQEK